VHFGQLNKINAFYVNWSLFIQQSFLLLLKHKPA